ncbi:MAG: polyphenol oxidase family protein [Acidimicrobiales bacterium]
MRTLWRDNGASGARIVALQSEVPDGDFSIECTDRDKNQQRLVAAHWTWLRQVHGNTVLRVDAPGDHSGAEADALVTNAVGAVLSVRTADCAPVVLFSEGGAVGIAHAGWKGLAAGVLEATVSELRSLCAGEVTAVLGPCIHSCCYEFGAAELDLLSAHLGDAVVGTTRSGAPALDLVAGVRAVLNGQGVELRYVDDACTEDPQLFSHRLRQQSERMVTCIWIET